MCIIIFGQINNIVIVIVNEGTLSIDKDCSVICLSGSSG